MCAGSNGLLSIPDIEKSDTESDFMDRTQSTPKNGAESKDA